MKSVFRMPVFMREIESGNGDIIIQSLDTGEFQSSGMGPTQMKLPDGTVVYVDPDGNILKDIVD
jgi:DNA/RNA-binding domain of Phe-tRNA-synthetase-like protein